ncbi:LysR family transcriptional regulator [Listeria cossartiae]|uniref:LysR family transcriptional regulator n=1 Tax=Listeria cossartiae TaxID=2838249 RepID=UPI0035E3C3F7
MVGNHIIFNENQAFHKLENVDLSAFPIHIVLALYSQSTVTTQIQQLEQELHVKLFDKIGRKMVLTSAGSDCCLL